MPWKSEIDRMVNRVVLDAAKGGEGEIVRAVRTLDDLLELAPDRPESHFHLGTADEILPQAAQEFEASEGGGARWRHLGRLEAAARRGDRERVAELMDDPVFAQSLEHPEGRVALRAIGRLLLRDGEDERVFALYVQHLDAVDDEGSRRDAEFLLEEALRRADRYDRGERDHDAALARLNRAAGFVDAAGLEARAGAKVDRKMGRLHQLGERWEDAVACYRRALERLPEDDPYRSVLVGDLALATLGVRGTLDLLPQAEREGRDDAIQILLDADGQGDGRSYNAIYTLGMLYYEQGRHEDALTCFREADDLMRANRAKARIVHARSRFFGAHCALELDPDDETLDAARRAVQKDAGPSNLEADLKTVVFDCLTEIDPSARIPGQRGDKRGDGRGDSRGDSRGGSRGDKRGDQGGDKRGRERAPRRREAPAGAAEHLEAALAALEEDPMKALQNVDRAFKSRPDFDTWFGAYRVRLAALIALNERDEALRTYERFRAKLYQRGTLDRIEQLLIDPDSPLADLYDDTERLQELVDLLEVVPDREDEFLEASRTCAQALLDLGDEASVGKALCMAREAAARDPGASAAILDAAEAAATEAGIAIAFPAEADGKKHVEALEEKPHVLLVGGDEGRRPHLAAFKELAGRVGFDGEWIFTGTRPPQRTLEDIEDSAQDASAILIHHGAGPDVRQEVKRLGEELEIPVREVPWMGRHGLETEVLRALVEDVE